MSTLGSISPSSSKSKDPSSSDSMTTHKSLSLSKISSKDSKNSVDGASTNFSLYEHSNKDFYSTDSLRTIKPSLSGSKSSLNRKSSTLAEDSSWGSIHSYGCCSDDVMPSNLTVTSSSRAFDISTHSPLSGEDKLIIKPNWTGQKEHEYNHYRKLDKEAKKAEENYETFRETFYETGQK